MKVKTKGVAVLAAVILISGAIFSQQNTALLGSNSVLGFNPEKGLGETNSLFRKHSIGLDFGKESGGAQLGITYRYFFEESKWNLRFNLNVGGESGNYYYDRNKMYFNTGDSTMPLLAVDRMVSKQSSYQRLDFGIERELNIWKLKLIAGIDGFIGHKEVYYYRGVHEVAKNELEENGNIYYEYSRFNEDGEFLKELNSLNTTTNYLNYGVALRLGFKVNLTDKFYATGFAGFRADATTTIKESQEYRNELYISHLPKYSYAYISTINSFANLGVHYRF